MEPRIVQLGEKRVAGKHISMSLSADRTPELWRSFMPQKKDIKNIVSGNELYDMQVYEPGFDFKNFTFDTKFEKWAAVEVSSHDDLPEGMEPYVINGGLYAVFIHKGAASDFEKTFYYIFKVWLPASVYELDDRVHFELLGAKYKNGHPDSEEEVWIPIKEKINS